MYDGYIKKIKSYLTVKRVIIICACLLLLISAWRIASNYISTAADYKRTLDRLESTEKQLAESRRLNRELNKLIEASRQLNNDAGDRIKRIEGYQQREGESLNRIEDNQRETGSRIGESLEHNNRARAEIESSLELIRRIEERNQKQ